MPWYRYEIHFSQGQFHYLHHAKFEVSKVLWTCWLSTHFVCPLLLIHRCLPTAPRRCVCVCGNSNLAQCNYGSASFPLDNLFGTFREKIGESKAYRGEAINGRKDDVHEKMRGHTKSELRCIIYRLAAFLSSFFHELKRPSKSFSAIFI